MTPLTLILVAHEAPSEGPDLKTPAEFKGISPADLPGNMRGTYSPGRGNDTDSRVEVLA